MTRSLVLLFLAFQVLTPLVWSQAQAPKCSVKDPYTVRYLPKHIDDDVGLCAVHAARTLLSQAACRRNECGNPENFNYSLAWLVKNRFDSTGERVSSLEGIIKSAADKGKAPLESCLPVDSYIPPDLKSFRSIPNNPKAALELLNMNYRNVSIYLSRKLCPQPENPFCSFQGKDLEYVLNHWSGEMNEFMKARGGVYNLISLNTKENDCPPIPVPSLAMKQVEITLETLTQNIANDMPVGLPICLESDRGCQGHATVAIGTRQYCCGNQCSTQIQLRDPQYSKWIKVYDQSWVDVSELLKVLMPNQKALVIDTKSPNSPAVNRPKQQPSSALQ